MWKRVGTIAGLSVIWLCIAGMTVSLDAQSAAKQTASATSPCIDASFLIGEWSLIQDGKPIGETTITPGDSTKCYLHQTIKMVGPTGSAEYVTLVSYSNAHHNWEMLYAWSGGGRGRAYNGVMDGGQFRFDAEATDGKLHRLSLTPNPDGSVSESNKISSDRGKTWTPDSADIVFRKKK